MAEEQIIVQPLTPRQRDVLREVVHCVRHYMAIGEHATQRAIARRLGMTHVRLRQHLYELYLKGHLRSPSIEGLHCLHTPQ